MYHFSFPVVSQQLVSWMNLNLRSPKLACRESYGEKNLTQLIQKNSSKWICGASCFRDRNRFLTEIKPSELESDSQLENRMKKKTWNNSFKKLVQKLFKLNLRCVMLSREKSLFDWNQTFRVRIWHLESRMKNYFYTVLPTLSEAVTEVSKIEMGKFHAQWAIEKELSFRPNSFKLQKN